MLRHECVALSSEMLSVWLSRRVRDASVELPEEDSVVAEGGLSARSAEAVKDSNLDAARLQLGDDCVEVGCRLRRIDDTAALTPSATTVIAARL